MSCCAPKIETGSPLANQRIADCVIGSQLGATVVGIWRGRCTGEDHHDP